MAKLDSPKNKIFELPLSQIKNDPYFKNRHHIEADDLIKSIKSVGQQNPIIVKCVGNEYQVISGFRRLTAIKHLRLPTVKAIVYEKIDNKAAHAISIAENMARESLSQLDIVMACKRLREQEKMNNEEISHIFNKNIRTIQRFLVVANADEKIKTALEKGRISIHLAYEIIKNNIPLEDVLKNKNMSVRELRRIASKNKKPSKYIQQKWFKNGNFNLVIYFKKSKHNKEEVIKVLEETIRQLRRA